MEGMEGWAGILDAITEAVLVVGPKGAIAQANVHAEHLLGYERGELLGRPAEVLVPAGGSLGEVERGVRKDGTEFPLEAELTTVESPDGELVVVVLRDITARRGQEYLFRGLLEAAPDAMVIVDGTGHIVLVNAQVEELFGYERVELIGQQVEALVPQRFAGGHVAFRRGYVHEPAARPMGLAGDLFARRKDGTEFPVEISLAPLETPEGLLVSAAVRDISERKRLQDEATRIKDEFFATVSHELRTPLTSMIGYAELLDDLGELGDQAQTFLAAISRSARRELRLVNDLLTLVNIEQSGLAMQRRPVELGELVRESIETARPDAEEAGIDIVGVLPDVAVHLSGDRDRIGQALDNLISNAVKFSGRDGRVSVTLGAEDRTATIDVTDSGPGLSEQDAERVFERLFRSSDAIRSQIPGAGLGLAITKAILDHHGGSVRVAETGPGGSTFRMVLPVDGS